MHAPRTLKHARNAHQNTLKALLAAVVTAALTFTLLVVSPFGQKSADAQALPGLINGVDVAAHQHPGGGPIDWRMVAGPGGQQFAFIKATEGTSYVNDFYAQDAQAANEAGIKVGAYHYARPATDPIAQARHFADTINAGPRNQLPPVLDLEVNEGLGPVQLAAWTQIFMAELEARTGRTPMLYTYRYFWYERMDNTNAFTRYPLWLAAYQNQPPAPVGGWDHLSFWQRSDSGRVPGIDAVVDMNLFNGNAGQFMSFAAGNLNAGGGVLEKFQASDSGELAVLEQDNTALVVAILALAGGALGIAGLAEAADQAGFSDQDARNIANMVGQLAENGELPVEDLRNMMIGDYQIGDLLILLDNATK
ncbi:glycoside hydrolase family 25 protein [Corynebacterium sp. HMSC071B10]|uniref:glycoside hydrolase family 25 protein n=1 Tax=Corynebacterium sp. HMSC071B10 TaxID=1739494 RepID=UPI0008A32558|nr:glycoside hydrolase family 25 protein [Corynebacterium sp. HMSC071B10]OFP36723.1 hydrolase [Corynebacterium sp. HMSC071B10]